MQQTIFQGKSLPAVHSEELDLVPQENIDELAAAGWIHLDNLDRVALFPFAKMGDYQIALQQKQGMQDLLREIFQTATEADQTTELFMRVLSAAYDQDEQLTEDMRRARWGQNARRYRANNGTNRQTNIRFITSISRTEETATRLLAVRITTESAPTPKGGGEGHSA